MEKLRKRIKNINEKFNTKKGLILVGLHVGFCMWLFRSLTLIYQGQNLTSTLLSSVIWGIGWALPLCLVGIFKGKPKDDKRLIGAIEKEEKK